MTTSIPVEFKKSSWREFLEYDTFSYFGSVYNADFNNLMPKIDEASKKVGVSFNRTFIKKTGTSLSFKTDKDTTSKLDKRGKVYKYKNFFIIYNESDGGNAIFYRYE